MENKIKKSLFKNVAQTVHNEKKLFWVFDQMKFALLLCYACDSARLVSPFGYNCVYKIILFIHKNFF